jgi:hypothetical protein
VNSFSHSGQIVMMTVSISRLKNVILLNVKGEPYEDTTLKLIKI